MQKKRKSNQGFTLVELVMVIILVGILSVGTISLFSSSNSYSSFLAKDLLISQALLAQQVALGDTANNNPVSLQVSEVSGQWEFRLSKQGAPEPVVSTVEHSGNNLNIDGGADNPTFTVQWTNQATIVGGTSHSFVFTGSESATYTVCLSAEGYAYELDAGAICR